MFVLQGISADRPGTQRNRKSGNTTTPTSDHSGLN
jgi:hypothetical protein